MYHIVRRVWSGNRDQTLPFKFSLKASKAILSKIKYHVLKYHEAEGWVTRPDKIYVYT